MASSTQDEEAHHRKEEDALHKEPELDQADLNKEAKTNDDEKIVASESDTSEAEKKKIMEQEVKDANQEDDDDKIVASESETSEAEKNKNTEQEVKDANEEEESRGDTMVMPSTTSPRSLTEEQEAKAREDDARYAEILLSFSGCDEDDSEQTLAFLTRWKAQETPPEKIIHGSLVEQCSRPVQKQLTTPDVKLNKLSLSRKKFQQLLAESEARHGKSETRFSVYGPDGKVHEIWLGGKKSSFDLTIGWWTFMEAYGLKECCDFVTVWMFRHRITQRICLAIDTTRFAFTKKVSKRISDAAFEDSDD